MHTPPHTQHIHTMCVYMPAYSYVRVSPSTFRNKHQRQRQQTGQTETCQLDDTFLSQTPASSPSDHDV